MRKAVIGRLRAVIGELHEETAATKDEEVFQVNIDVFGI